MLKSIEHIDEPWSYEDIKGSYFANFTTTERLIKATEGGVLWSELSALHACLAILNSCTNDILDAISEFSHATTKPRFWDLINRVEQERYANQLKKHVFCTASAAMALVGHARNFSKKYPVDGLMQKRNECFGNTGLHHFIQGLRNYVVHVKVAEANWLISWKGANKKREVKFLFNAIDLREFKKWKPDAKQFIDQNEDGIDVYQIFLSYLQCANNYYSWHRARVIANYSPVLEMYFVYERYLNKIKESTKWNLIISHAKEGLDVFQYLDKYLTPQQIEDVLGYKNGSQQQVDRLIEIIDVYKACDDELKEKIYSKLIRNIK